MSEVVCEPGDGWLLTVPPGLSCEREPDDNSLVLWDDTRTLRISTLTTSGSDDGSPFSAEQMLGERASDATPNAHGVLIHVGPEDVEPADEDRYRSFTIRAADTNALMIVSLFTLEAGDEPLRLLVAGVARRATSARAGS